MAYRRPPARTTKRGRRVPLVLLVAMTVVGAMPVRAHAVPASDVDHTGNGRHNRNSITVRSPEYNWGIQHVTNTNVDGTNTTQAAFCKRWFRHCRISQRIKAVRH